jgi:1,3-beta-glucanosyltransferase GAS1
MTPVLSGSIVYEWTQEVNDYGIVQYPDNAIQSGVQVAVGSPIPLQPEFNNLMSVWASVSPSSTSLADYTPSVSTIACPATTSGVWTIDGSAPLPDTPGSLSAPPSPSYSFTGTLPPVPTATVNQDNASEGGSNSGSNSPSGPPTTTGGTSTGKGTSTSDGIQ